jgi:DinB superfamily
MREWLDDFKQTIESSAERLLQLDESKTAQEISEDKWSAKEIIGHLIDSAANNHSRFVLAQVRDDLVFPGYEQNKWVEIQHYREEPWPDLVDLWRAYNLHLLHVMTVTPEAKLKNLCFQHTMHAIAWKTVSEREPVTLEYLMQDYIAHLKHHLAQIFGEAV